MLQKIVADLSYSNHPTSFDDVTSKNETYSSIDKCDKICNYYSQENRDVVAKKSQRNHI